LNLQVLSGLQIATECSVALWVNCTPDKVTGVIKKIGNIFRAGLLSLFSTPIYPLQMRHSDIQKCDHELSRVPLAGLLMLDMQAF
jgi:hypothetical protein